MLWNKANSAVAQTSSPTQRLFKYLVISINSEVQQARIKTMVGGGGLPKPIGVF
jgi:hypothetical protein